MNEFILNLLEQVPAINAYQSEMATSISVVVILIGAGLSYYVVLAVLVRLLTKLIDKSKSNLDDVLIRHRVFNRIAYIVPAWLIYNFVPLVVAKYPIAALVVVKLTSIYLVLAIAMVVDALISSLVDIYRSVALSKRISIQSFAQVAKLIVYFVAAILVVSIVVGESPITLFAGLGAMTAVLMLVFRDPILGFVAGLQLSYNRMVSLGDWVDIPQHNASGDVMEIGLTTVKVRNFDNTITTVPTQHLVADSFKNWRGMQDSAGRRIKRSIVIDITSISFCDQQRIARYSKIDYIQEYIESKTTELTKHNQQKVKNPELAANGRHITNIGTFRAYVLAYLQNHPDINQDLTVMVRQLAATDAGVPLEIYAFSAIKEWAKYESIQADIFDHLFAVAAEFDLRVFQKPSGRDFQRLIQ